MLVLVLLMAILHYPFYFRLEFVEEKRGFRMQPKIYEIINLNGYLIHKHNYHFNLLS